MSVRRPVRLVAAATAVAGWSLLLAAPLATAQAEPGPGDPSTASAPASAAQLPPGASARPAEADDRGWPREFQANGQTVTVSQPQVEQWPGFGRITFRAAISVGPTGSGERTFGVLRMSADTKVAFEERLVVLTGRRVESLTFQDTDAARSEELRRVVLAAAPPEQPQSIALDRLVAALDPATVNARQVDVNLAPPPIHYSARPAVLVVFLGKPRFRPAPGGDLMFAINTNWDVFLDPAASRYYLLDSGSWLQTGDLDKGPWTAAVPPPALSQLPDDPNWKDVRAALPGTPAAEVPTVFVSHAPAELLVTVGAPEFEPLPGTSLMLVANTDAKLVYDAPGKRYYLLSAGRWFAAADLSGPWTAASTSLPGDFRRIPAESDTRDLLASVPGTPQAKDAVVLASIPETATIQRALATLDVDYDGAPRFEPIPGTPVTSARNTDFDVFHVGDAYYCCHAAVWFVAPSPTGPWVVCDVVAEAIYGIPPTWPQYNVTYVHVVSSTPSTVVFSYTSGYTGDQVASTGTVMFGFGQPLDPGIDDEQDCCWDSGCSPIWFSYGCGAHYLPAYGGYVCGSGLYGPYGGAGRYATYNPAAGTWSRGAYAYGPAGAAGYRAAWNPATGTAAYRAGAVTPYGSWGRAAVTNGDEWLRGGHASGARGGVAAVQGSEGGAAVHARTDWGNGVTVAQSRDGDLYAGKDGNVYRKTDAGWEPAHGSAWSPAGGERTGVPPDRPEAAPASRGWEPPAEAGDLQRDFQSRSRGDFSSARTSRFLGAGGRAGGYGGGFGGRGRR